MTEQYQPRPPYPDRLRKLIAETEIEIDKCFAASAAIFGSAFTISVALGVNFALGWELNLRLAGGVGLALGFAAYKLATLRRKSNTSNS
jgi:hypothetical protein